MESALGRDYVGSRRGAPLDDSRPTSTFVRVTAAPHLHKETTIMSVTKLVKQQQLLRLQSRSTTPSRKSGTKSEGTRAGTLEDWREGGKKAGRPSVGVGKTVRDGR